MEDKAQVCCLFCEFKTKTKESIQQHINSKHETKASSYDEAMKMLGTPAIEGMIKTIQNLQKEKQIKEQMVVKLEKELQEAHTHLEILKTNLEEKCKALERSDTETVATQTLPEADIEVTSEIETQETIEEMEPSKSKKNCRYFNTAKGCKRGTTCYFKHNMRENNCSENKKEKLKENVEPIKTKIVNDLFKESEQKQEAVKNEPASKQESERKTTKCKYFKREKGCRRGKTCHFSHESENDQQDCKFWLKGKCKFPANICWNNHNSETKGKSESKEIEENLYKSILQLMLNVVLQQ